MSDLYRIKPLVFVDTPLKTALTANPPGTFYFIMTNNNVWMWRSEGFEYEPCASRKAAEKNCNDHYHAFISQALEEVE